jgi:hypothetical protein
MEDGEREVFVLENILLFIIVQMSLQFLFLDKTY